MSSEVESQPNVSVKLEEEDVATTVVHNGQPEFSQEPIELVHDGKVKIHPRKNQPAAVRAVLKAGDHALFRFLVLDNAFPPYPEQSAFADNALLDICDSLEKPEIRKRLETDTDYLRRMRLSISVSAGGARKNLKDMVDQADILEWCKIYTLDEQGRANSVRGLLTGGHYVFPVINSSDPTAPGAVALDNPFDSTAIINTMRACFFKKIIKKCAETDFPRDDQGNIMVPEPMLALSALVVWSHLTDASNPTLDKNDFSAKKCEKQYAQICDWIQDGIVGPAERIGKLQKWCQIKHDIFKKVKLSADLKQSSSVMVQNAEFATVDMSKW